jgi:hypothetical protein
MQRTGLALGTRGRCLVDRCEYGEALGLCNCPLKHRLQLYYEAQWQWRKTLSQLQCPATPRSAMEL